MSMETLNIIKKSEFYFIDEIKEVEENVLQFELICGTVSKDKEDVFIGEHYLGVANAILPNNAYRYKITFDDYIGYSVLNESYAETLEDNFIGYNPRIYSQSKFLDYIKADTFATNDYPGEFKHFAFLSENHVINVASVSPPKVEQINT